MSSAIVPAAQDRPRAAPAGGGGVGARVLLVAPVGRRGAMDVDEPPGHLRYAGRSPAALETAAGAVGRWMDARAAGGPAGGVAALRDAAVAPDGVTARRTEAMVAVPDTPDAPSLYRAGTADALAAIDAPVPARFAGRDEIVRAASVQATRRVLAGRAGSPVEVFADLPHNPRHAVAPGTAAPYPAPEVAARVALWQTTVLRPRATRGAARRSG